ncbi:hypothetical protein, partial [Albidovulum sp.]|uniref:hypothetical protein n=1 Tax=Albidovulum sp. TaxID=1872424 RepID=UPI0039B89E77
MRMTSRAGADRYPLGGMPAATGAFAALQAVAAWHAGVFEYPLDDVYIHLAMAEKIAQGTYGVNLGDPASASSSILYPFLLLPFPGTEAQRLLPLFWNILAVAGAGWVWGLIAAAARLAGAAGMAIVVAGPVFLNIPGVGYTGMEAAPHLLASLVVVLGLWLALNRKGAAWWLVGAAIAAPLLRYEGLALSLAAAATLWLWGHRRAAGVIACGALGAVIGFSVFFLYLGLDPLPGSILAKIGTLDPQGGIGSRLLVGLLANLIKPAGAILAGLVVAVVATAVAIPALRRGPAGAIVATVGVAASAHLVFGQVGWMHRYEPYIIVSLLAAFLLAGSAAGFRAARIAQGAALGTTAAAAIAYGPTLWGAYVWNPRAIHLQQAQMARFAQEYLKAPVAVNDLGRVAWGNPEYVLDISGARLCRGSTDPLRRGPAGGRLGRTACRAARRAGGDDLRHLVRLGRGPGLGAGGNAFGHPAKRRDRRLERGDLRDRPGLRGGIAHAARGLRADLARGRRSRPGGRSGSTRGQGATPDHGERLASRRCAGRAPRHAPWRRANPGGRVGAAPGQGAARPVLGRADRFADRAVRGRVGCDPGGCGAGRRR